VKMAIVKNILQLSLVLFFLEGAEVLSEQVSAPWQPNEKLAELATLFETGENHQLVVAQDGSGDFNSIQQAVDAVAKYNTQRVVILIKPGIYKERVKIPKNKPFITLRGTDPYKTIISYNLTAKMMKPDGSGPYGADCATVIVWSPDFIAEGLTIENSHGKPSPQAQAAKFVSERALFVNCRFIGWQDTLLTHSGRQYYLNCYIEGGTDFIYGHAQAVFETCRIYCKKKSHITAHAATEPNMPTGYVFYNCRIVTAEGIMTDLGRPWRPYARVVYYNCWLDKGILPEGWNNWRDPAREKTAFYAEYKSHGPGANPSARVKWSHQLTDEQAEKFLPENFMKIDGKTTDKWLQTILDFRKSSAFDSKSEELKANLED